MKYNHEIHHRKSYRLKEYDYSQAGFYFVTICTRNREQLFGEINDGVMILNDFGKIVENWIKEISIHFDNVEIDYFCIMPNHVHIIININESDIVGAIHELPLQRRQMLLPKIIGYFKMNSSKQINIFRNSSGIPVWQRNYYEHIIKNDKELFEIRKYIEYNQLNWKDDEYNS